MRVMENPYRLPCIDLLDKEKNFLWVKHWILSIQEVICFHFHFGGEHFLPKASFRAIKGCIQNKIISSWGDTALLRTEGAFSNSADN